MKFFVQLTAKIFEFVGLCCDGGGVQYFDESFMKTFPKIFRKIFGEIFVLKIGWTSMPCVFEYLSIHEYFHDGKYYVTF